MTDWERLVAEADIFSQERPLLVGQQLLVTLAKSGQARAYLNDLSSESETGFLKGQREPLRAILCRWSDGQPDVPSQRVCRGLLAAFGENRDADVYLMTSRGVSPRKLSSLEGR